MRRKLLILVTILTVIVPLISPAPLQAADDPDLNKDALNDALYNFCQKRDGNTMNLETWYAGKCGTNNPLSYEGTGFGDIIILHALEFLIGEQQQTGDAIIETIKEKFTTLQNQSDTSSSLVALSNFSQAVNQSTPQDGLVPGTSKLITTLFENPPARTNQYIASVKSNLARHKLVSPAYAQTEGGYGFTHLQGFLLFWRAFRNIAYLIFVILFMVYGFMIMFRIKINPQTAVNIQMALPKLVVTLLLITFSYAIVGLMFDLIWFIFFLGFSALEAFGVIGIKWWPDVVDFSKYGNLFTNIASGRAGLFLSWIYNSVVAFFIGVPSAIGAVLGIGAGAPAVGLIALNIFIPGALVVTLIIGIIFIIATAISYIKLFFKLIGAYITVIINLIFAPLILLGNVFPGSKSVGNWLKNIFANLMVFPATAFLLLFSFIFTVQPIAHMFSFSPLHATVPARVPVLFPFQLGGASSIYALIGLGLLFMTPKYVDMVKDAFQVEPFKFGADLSFITKSGIAREVSDRVSRKATTKGAEYIGSEEKLKNLPAFIKKWAREFAKEERQKQQEGERLPNT